MSDERVSFTLQIEDSQGHRGRGEATPLHYRGETPDDLASELEKTHQVSTRIVAADLSDPEGGDRLAQVAGATVPRDDHRTGRTRSSHRLPGLALARAHRVRSLDDRKRLICELLVHEYFSPMAPPVF